MEIDWKLLPKLLMPIWVRIRRLPHWAQGGLVFVAILFILWLVLPPFHWEQTGLNELQAARLRISADHGLRWPLCRTIEFDPMEAEPTNHEMSRSERCFLTGRERMERRYFKPLAIDALCEALKNLPKNDVENEAAIRNNLGICYLYAGDLTAARKEFERSAKLKSKDDEDVFFASSSLLNDGIVEFFDGNYAKSDRSLLQALEHKIRFVADTHSTPANAKALRQEESEIDHYLGLNRLFSNDFTQARIYFQKALEVDPPDDLIDLKGDQLCLGIVFQCLGDRDDARQYYEILVAGRNELAGKLDPDEVQMASRCLNSTKTPLEKIVDIWDKSKEKH